MTPNENKAFGTGMISGIICFILGFLLVNWVADGEVSCYWAVPTSERSPQK